MTRQRITTVPKREIVLVLPFLGFSDCFNLKIIFRNTRGIKSFFPYKGRFSRSQMSKVFYKASCWDCDEFYIGKSVDYTIEKLIILRVTSCKYYR